MLGTIRMLWRYYVTNRPTPLGRAPPEVQQRARIMMFLATGRVPPTGEVIIKKRKGGKR